MSDMSDYEDDQPSHGQLQLQPQQPGAPGAQPSSAYDPKRHAREQHNALERRRRDNIKDMYTSLREVVPDANGERVQASRAVILKKAIETIEKGQTDATTLAAEIAAQEATNARMKDEIARLKARKKAAAVAAAANAALMLPTPTVPQPPIFLPPLPPQNPPK